MGGCACNAEVYCIFDFQMNVLSGLLQPILVFLFYHLYGITIKIVQ